jgi:hypothetical protein
MPRYRFIRSTQARRALKSEGQRSRRAKLRAARLMIISVLDEAIMKGESRASLKCLRETLKIFDKRLARTVPTAGYTSTDSTNSTNIPSNQTADDSPPPGSDHEETPVSAAQCSPVHENVCSFMCHICIAKKSSSSRHFQLNV